MLTFLGKMTSTIATKMEGLRKGSVVYSFQNYLYYKTQETKTSIILKCGTNRRCHGRAKMCKQDNTCTVIFDHTHATVEDKIRTTMLKSELKNTSENSADCAKDVFDKVCSRYDDQITSKISFPSVRSMMVKRKYIGMPTIPNRHTKFVDELVKHEKFRQHFKGCIKDLHDEVQASIFFDDQTIAQLPSFEVVAYDGTFKITPSFVVQLFIIYAQCGPRFLPVFYVFMNHRNINLYEKVLTKIKFLVPNFRPRYAIGDFEKASKLAFERVFANIKMQGCFFHFKYALKRRLGKLNLKGVYRNNQTVNQLIKLAMASPLLPSDKLPFFIDQLRGVVVSEVGVSVRSRIKCFFKYFEKQWLRSNLELINFYNAKNPTNNCSETFNKQLNAKCASNHNNIWKTIIFLNQKMRTNFVDLKRIMAGVKTTRQRKESERAGLSKDLKRRYEQSEISELDLLAQSLDIIPNESIRRAFGGHYVIHVATA